MELLGFSIWDLPVWAWVVVILGGSTLFLLYLIGSGLEAVRKIAVGWRVVLRVFTQPKTAISELTTEGETATAG